MRGDRPVQTGQSVYAAKSLHAAGPARMAGQQPKPMRVAPPVLPAQLEDAIPLEQALSLAQAFEQPVREYQFTGGSAAGMPLEKTEYKACVFRDCRFTGTVLANAWFQNAVFENCDFSGASLMEATLQKVRFVRCKLTGANFTAAVFTDVSLEDCIAQDAVFSEAALKNVLFLRGDFSGAAFWDVRKRSVFRFGECRLERAEFLHTSLNGQDLTGCDITGASFSGEGELRGARVTALQACELAKLLGVIIEG